MAAEVQRTETTSPTSLGSSEEDLEQSLPSTLAKEELQLALNNVTINIILDFCHITNIYLFKDGNFQ